MTLQIGEMAHLTGTPERGAIGQIRIDLQEGMEVQHQRLAESQAHACFREVHQQGVQEAVPEVDLGLEGILRGGGHPDLAAWMDLGGILGPGQVEDGGIAFLGGCFKGGSEGEDFLAEQDGEGDGRARLRHAIAGVQA
jgi:hypothetical protein